eukprot:scaffold78386_cov63-Phaeocystis_antarctica.AAC.1
MGGQAYTARPRSRVRLPPAARSRSSVHVASYDLSPTDNFNGWGGAVRRYYQLSSTGRVASDWFYWPPGPSNSLALLRVGRAHLCLPSRAHYH